MSLLTVIIILIAWAIIGGAEKAKPQNPPIEDMDAHLKKVMRASSKTERRKIQ